MSEPVIEVHHLSKSFGTHVVLRDVDFTVNAGDVTCIIGASGSGKSTLLRCINLLETPTNGKVLFHGSDITAKGSDPCAYRAKVGMVFQSFNLFNNMTVLDNCTAGLRYGSDSLFEYFIISKDYAVCEVAIPQAWIGKTVGDLNIRKNYHINILALKKGEELTAEITPQTVFTEDHTILILGKKETLEQFY